MLILFTIVLGEGCLGRDVIQSELPNPFVRGNQTVSTLDDWKLHRSELIDTLINGRVAIVPPLPDTLRVEHLQTREIYLPDHGVWAELTQAQLVFGPGDCLRMDVGYWRSRDSKGPSPVILAMEPVWWDAPFVKNGVVGLVLSRGYALAGFDHKALASFEDPAIRSAQVAYPGCDWGVVAVGAWGFRVIMTYLESEKWVAHDKVAIWDHSRRGKSCLLAGALDERFAAVIPHMSGMGGAAAYRVRGKGAQRLEQLLERYWMKASLFDFIDREDTLPFDNHWLWALVAPRLLFSHVGLDDAWGNPKGEQAAYQAALEVYRWMGVEDHVGIYFGNYGHHDPNGPEGSDSWETLLQWLDWHWKGLKPEKEFHALHFDPSIKGFSWSAPEPSVSNVKVRK